MSEDETAKPRMVQCVKLQREAPGLDAPPYDNDLGRRIFENVSQEAWAEWQHQETVIINEYRLQMFRKEHRETLYKHCEDFFFGDAPPAMPTEYQPE